MFTMGELQNIRDLGTQTAMLKSPVSAKHLVYVRPNYRTTHILNHEHPGKKIKFSLDKLPLNCSQDLGN